MKEKMTVDQRIKLLDSVGFIIFLCLMLVIMVDIDGLLDQLL